MAAVMQEIEVWAMVNDDGEYEVGTNDDEARERFEENCSANGGRRLVKLTVKVPLPATIELTGEVAIDEQPGELKAV